MLRGAASDPLWSLLLCLKFEHARSRLPQGLFESGAVDASAHVRVTGHSLGGALAVLAALDIAEQLKPPSLQVCGCVADLPAARLNACMNLS